MDFTDTQVEILVDAFLLSLEGKGQVVQHECIPDAHWLCEAGWLDRRIEENGDVSWWWTPQAEGALRMSELMEGQSQN